MLAARIDLLPADERRALRSAAVVGRVFWKGPVAKLLDEESELVDERLGRLEDRELVLSQLGSRIAGEREFLFKHVLTRDVAYGTLARRDRARAHADVAAWIESAAGGRQREFADLLAHHLGLAYEGSVADSATPPDRREELRRRSLQATLAASAEARNRMLLEKANAFGEAALGLAADAHERSLALEALGLCGLWNYRGDDAWRYLSEAVDERLVAGREVGEPLAMLCARAVEPPTRWPASMAEQPDEATVARYVEIGLEHAAPEGEARVRLLIARGMWVFAFRRDGFTEGDAEAAREAGEEAFALAEMLGRDDLASAALDGVGSIEFILGLHGRTWPVIERRLAIVERLSDPWEIGDAFQTAADVALAVGRYHEALRWASEGYERARGGPDVWRAGLAWRSIARFKLGDWDGAIEDFERMEAARATTRFGSVGYFTLTMWSCVALIHELRGERAAADRLATGMVAGTPRHRDDPEDPVACETGGVPRFGRGARADRGERVLGAEHGEGRDPRGALRRDRRPREVGARRRRGGRGPRVRRGALLVALPLHAYRLEGRVALERDDTASAVAALTRAREGFASLGAAWETPSPSSGSARRSSRQAPPTTHEARRRRRSACSTRSAPCASPSERAACWAGSGDASPEPCGRLVIHNPPRLGDWALTL